MIELVRTNTEFNPQPANASLASTLDAQPMSDTVAGPARLPHQLDQAIAEFEDPAVPLLLKHARVLVKAREHRLATNLFRTVVLRSPDHPQALHGLGVCFREEGRFDQALKCFRALAKTTRTIDAQILVAETLYLSERDEMALGAYREVLKNVIADQSQLFDIYKNVGNLHVRAGDFDAAEEYYNKAYCLQPGSEVLLVNYGTLEIQRENLGAAVERFRKALEVNPENDKAWVGLAIVHRQMGDAELARGNADRALDINPKNRTAIRLAVEWYVQDGFIAACIEPLQNYLANESEDAEMSFTLSKIFTQMGRLSEARMELERVLALDPMMEGADRLAFALDQELSKRCA